MKIYEMETYEVYVEELIDDGAAAETMAETGSLSEKAEGQLRERISEVIERACIEIRALGPRHGVKLNAGVVL